MIQAAEERRSNVPEAEAGRLQFLTADLRSLRLSVRLPLVLAPQNALGVMSSLDDLGAVLATVRHHLEPLGAFVFDVAHPSAPGGSLASRPEEDSARPPSMVEPLRPVFAPHLRERRRTSGDAGSIHRLRLRHFEPAEIDLVLRETGLVALERFGSFDGKPFDQDDPVQIVVAGLVS